MVRARARSAISLFSGAGGFDVGLEAAGFKILLCVEIDEDARSTLRRNRPRWRLADPGDIVELDSAEILRQAGARRRQVDLLVGGPPCQPFSRSKLWARGAASHREDPRAEMLAQYVSVLRGVLPTSFILENVDGLAFNGARSGLRSFLSQVAAVNRFEGTRYRPQCFEVNAADYGVPQIRRRMFIVGHRDGLRFELPPGTHGLQEGKRPYLTAWDAIGSLQSVHWNGELSLRGKWADLVPSIPEGKNYLWHTRRSGGQPLFGWRTRYWSFLLKLAKDEPAWTIQACPGPATGPFHWKNRLLSTDELARLQTFPLSYSFVGSRDSCHRQIGNAVPPALGELFGLEVRRQHYGERVRDYLELIPFKRTQVPRRERIRQVPDRYLQLRGDHADHPGVGRGPGAVSAPTQEQQ